MNTCAICQIPQLELHDITTRQHGTVGICADCLAALVDDELDNIEQCKDLYCRTCQHYTAPGCMQNLTPATCC